MGRLLTASRNAAGILLVRVVKHNGKSKVLPVQVMKAYGENRGTAPFIRTRSARLKFVGNFMPGRFTLEKQPIEPKSGWTT